MCLIDQYDKYKIGDMQNENEQIVPVNVNGSLTIAENIADTGVSAAYKAYGKNLQIFITC